jgi:hypothetical protein
MAVLDAAVLDVPTHHERDEPFPFDIRLGVDDVGGVVSGRHADSNSCFPVSFQRLETRFEVSKGLEVSWGAQYPRLFATKPSWIMSQNAIVCSPW